MTDHRDPPTREELSRRLEAARKHGADDAGPEAGRGRAMGIAMRMATDLVVGLGVGLLIGYYLDLWLGTRPWAMVIMVPLGLAAGFRNMMRAARELQAMGEEPGPED